MSTIIGFSGQIIFLDKVLYISKRCEKNKKKSLDMDGKPVNSVSYNIAFHYENGEVSQICYNSEEERDTDYNYLLKQLGVDKRIDIKLS